MLTKLLRVVLALAAVLLLVIAQQRGFATPPAAAEVPKTSGPQLSSVQLTHGEPVTPKEFTGDVRTLPRDSVGQPRVFRAPLEHEAPSLQAPKIPLPGAGAETSAPQAAGPVAIPTPIVSFNGLDFNTWGAGWPPDPVGDVGPNHYIQAVNTSIGIFSKTGTQLAAFTFDALWASAGSGTACDNSNGGDPTVVYDPQADRWFVADFAFTGAGTAPPFYECLAVSQTGNPVTGGWWLYAIRADDGAHPWFPDYPKMGIWPDGLYMSANMFLPSGARTFQEVRVWAFNRFDLEAGATVRYIVGDLGTNAYFSLLPSNVRGLPPPAGRENLFVSEDQTAFAFDVFKFHADYSGGGSTFTGPTQVSQTSYTAPQSTVPTPGNRLDSLGDRLMMQAQYRNIAGTESLWVNHTIRTATGANATTGVQWAQINVTGGTINTTPVQQQKYSNGGDTLFRWMGSLAVDNAGDMALGFSAANSTTAPDIRYAGRLMGDPANTLAQGETTMLVGVTRGSQTGNCGGGTCTRWGDYSAMSVDPTDDCAFWYTNEYYAASGLNWQTRISSFKFPSCVPTVVQWGDTTGGSGAALQPPGLYFDAANGNASQVFVGGTNGIEAAYRGAGGSQIWSRTLAAGAGIFNRGPIIPINNVNVAFFTSSDGYVNALKVSDGTSFWAGGGTLIGPSTIAGLAYAPGLGTAGRGLILAGTFDNSGPTNKLVALNAADGTIAWQFTNSGNGGLGLVVTTPAVDTARNIVYFGTKDVTGGGGGGHGVWALDLANNGALLWSRTNIGGALNGAATLSDDHNTLYIATLNGTSLYALDVSPGGNGATRPGWPFTPGSTFTGTPWIDSGYLYVSNGGNVYARDAVANTNKTGWPTGGVSVPGAGTLLVGTLAGHPAIYTGSSTGMFNKLSLATGAVTAQLNLGQGSAPVSDATYDVLRDAFYITCNGYLYSINGSW